MKMRQGLGAYLQLLCFGGSSLYIEVTVLPLYPPTQVSGAVAENAPAARSAVVCRPEESEVVKGRKPGQEEDVAELIHLL